MAGITSFCIGIVLFFFGITSLERNALRKYNIPDEHFLWIEKNKIERKTIQIATPLTFIYLLIILVLFVPSRAESSYGLFYDCCSIILLILFIVIFVILRITVIYKLKKDYLKRLEEDYKIR
jgi:amino acid transporter